MRTKRIIKNTYCRLNSFLAFIIWRTGLYAMNNCVKELINNLESEIIKYKSNSTGKFKISRPYRIIGMDHIRFEGNFTALSDLRIECFNNYNGIQSKPLLEIMNNVTLNQRCHIACINHIRIGKNVLVGSNVLITDHSHGRSCELDLPPNKRTLYSKGPVMVGDNTWICDNVCILPNVHIGENCIIGAGCIVNKDVPSNCIVVGNPMRIVKNSTC